jgi:hypothetical protein
VIDLLESRVAAGGDAAAQDLYVRASGQLAASLSDGGKPDEAARIKARVRSIRLRDVTARVDSRGYLPRSPKTVSAAAIDTQFARFTRENAARILQLAEQLFRQRRTPDAAVDVAEACLGAAEHADPRAADHRATVAGYLCKILDVYADLSGRQPLSAEEQ